MRQFECESCGVDAFTIFEFDEDLLILCEGCQAAYKLLPKGWTAEKISDGPMDGSGDEPGAVVSETQGDDR